MIENHNKKKGIVILFSVLLVSIVLTISLSLFNITFKQLILSSTAKESQASFFAAISGVECAKHWNARHDPLDTVFGYYNFVDPDTERFEFPGDLTMTINCFNDAIDVDGESVGNEYVSNFSINFQQGGRNSCVDVEVRNRIDGDQGTIIATGYNNVIGLGNSCSDTNRVTDRTVQRAFVLSY